VRKVLYLRLTELYKKRDRRYLYQGIWVSGWNRHSAGHEKSENGRKEEKERGIGPEKDPAAVHAREIHQGIFRLNRYPQRHGP